MKFCFRISLYNASWDLTKKVVAFVIPVTLLFASSVFADANADEKKSITILPIKVLFTAPIADPKWPKFSAGYQQNSSNPFGNKFFNFTFGENIGLYQMHSEHNRFEFGVQTGVFGLMELSKIPTRLVNTDYFVGLGISHKRGNWKNLWQLSHLSSHVGDELLLSRAGKSIDRINLSYESLKWLTRVSLGEYSPYFGIGYILHIDPHRLKRTTFEAGIDYNSHKKILQDKLRFIAGLHLHSWQENKFKPSIVTRFGFQIENVTIADRHVQLLVNAGIGKSQDGQFFASNNKYIGLMITFSS